MTIKRLKSSSGFTLIEVMLAIVVLVVAVLGASAFRYSAALGARKADAQTTAAQTALLLCETWRGLAGDETYDPVAHFGSELTIISATDPNSSSTYTAMPPYDFTLLGVYEIASSGATCYATLAWKDVDTGLRALNVVVAWPLAHCMHDYPNEYAYKSFKLTTYVIPN